MVLLCPPRNRKPSHTRLLKVREKEKEFEATQANRFKQRKEKKKQKLLRLFKELWREKQECKLAMLQKKCRYAIQHIAHAHTAAILFMQDQEARNLELEKLAEINHQMAAVRYKNALQKERLRKEEESEPKFLAARRKSTKDIAAVQERNLEKFATRRRNLKAISNSPSLHVSGWFSEQKKTIRFLQPSDFKYTFLHSQLFMDEGGMDPALKCSKIDAWKAAEIQRQVMAQNNLTKMELKNIMDKRKSLRGQLAGSQIMIEQKLQLLEEEMKIESSEKDKKMRDATEEVVGTSFKGSFEGVEQGEQGSQADSINKDFDSDNISSNSEWSNSMDLNFLNRDVGQKIKDDKLKHTFRRGKQMFSEVPTSKRYIQESGINIATSNNKEATGMSQMDNIRIISSPTKKRQVNSSRSVVEHEDMFSTTPTVSAGCNNPLTAESDLQKEEILPFNFSHNKRKSQVGCRKLLRFSQTLKHETGCNNLLTAESDIQKEKILPFNLPHNKTKSQTGCQKVLRFSQTPKSEAPISSEQCALTGGSNILTAESDIQKEEIRPFNLPHNKRKPQTGCQKVLRFSQTPKNEAPISSEQRALTGGSNLLAAESDRQKEEILPFKSPHNKRKSQIGSRKVLRFSQTPKNEAPISNERCDPCTNCPKVKNKRRACMEQVELQASAYPRNITRKRVECPLQRVKPIIKSLGVQKSRKSVDFTKNLCNEKQHALGNTQQSSRARIAGFNREEMKLNSAEYSPDVRPQELAAGNKDSRAKAEEPIEKDERHECKETKNKSGSQKLAEGNKDIRIEAKEVVEKEEKHQNNKRTQHKPVVRYGNGRRAENSTDAVHELRHRDMNTEKKRTSSLSHGTGGEAEPSKGIALTLKSRHKHAKFTQSLKMGRPRSSSNPNLTKIYRAPKHIPKNSLNPSISNKSENGNVHVSTANRRNTSNSNEQIMLDNMSSSTDKLQSANEAVKEVAMELVKLDDYSLSSSVDSQLISTPAVQTKRVHDPLQPPAETHSLNLPSMTSSEDGQGHGYAHKCNEEPIYYGPTDRQVKESQSASWEASSNDIQGLARKMRGLAMEGDLARKVGDMTSQDLGRKVRDVVTREESSATIESTISRSFESYMSRATTPQSLVNRSKIESYISRTETPQSLVNRSTFESYISRATTPQSLVNRSTTESCISRATTPQSFVTRSTPQIVSEAETAQVDDPMNSILASLSNEVKKLDARLRSVNVNRTSGGQCDVSNNNHSNGVDRGYESRNLNFDDMVDVNKGGMIKPSDEVRGQDERQQSSNAALFSDGQGYGSKKNHLIGVVDVNKGGCESKHNHLNNGVMNVHKGGNMVTKPSKERSTYGIFKFESVTPSVKSSVSTASL